MFGCWGDCVGAGDERFYDMETLRVADLTDSSLSLRMTVGCGFEICMPDPSTSLRYAQLDN